VVRIRYGTPADAGAIAGVRHASWQGAYTGILAPEIIERETGHYDPGRERARFAARPWRRTLVAEPAPPAPPPATPVRGSGIIGYASFGPERDADGIPIRHQAGPARPPGVSSAELYAIYVTPAWWSTGAGRDLLRRVLQETQAEGYPRIVLWVLERNTRARRFYERSGFRLDGRAHGLDWLGGVTEVRYSRGLARP